MQIQEDLRVVIGGFGVALGSFSVMAFVNCAATSQSTFFIIAVIKIMFFKFTRILN